MCRGRSMQQRWLNQQPVSDRFRLTLAEGWNTFPPHTLRALTRWRGGCAAEPAPRPPKASREVLSQHPPTRRPTESYLESVTTCREGRPLLLPNV